MYGWYSYVPNLKVIVDCSSIGRIGVFYIGFLSRFTFE